MFKLWERWGAALGTVGVVVWAIAFIFGNDSPESGDSDAEDLGLAREQLASEPPDHRVLGHLTGALCVIGFSRPCGSDSRTAAIPRWVRSRSGRASQAR